MAALGEDRILTNFSAFCFDSLKRQKANKARRPLNLKLFFASLFCLNKFYIWIHVRWMCKFVILITLLSIGAWNSRVLTKQDITETVNSSTIEKAIVVPLFDHKLQYFLHLSVHDINGHLAYLYIYYLSSASIVTIKREPNTSLSVSARFFIPSMVVL